MIKTFEQKGIIHRLFCETCGREMTYTGLITFSTGNYEHFCNKCNCSTFVDKKFPLKEVKEFPI